MIGPWQIVIAGVAGLALFGAGFGAGWQMRAGIDAEGELADEEANTAALASKLEQARSAAQEARQRALEAAERVDTLEGENAVLRASLSWRASNVQISDPCAQCRLGADAVGVLVDAAAGSVDDPER